MASLLNQRKTCIGTAFRTGFFSKRLLILLCICICSCVTNPLTGKRTMAFVDNSQLFPSSFQQYGQFLQENTVIKNTADARLVEKVGVKIKEAAEKWLAAEGQSGYLDGYEWEYNLVRDDTVNAWCMPGGKIVIYTGILPVTKTEAGLATVMGHEVAHALLNHSQQRMSAGILQELGAAGLSIFTSAKSAETQALAMTIYGAGSEIFGTLPFSREHESEADHIGLMLMAIAGYNPEESVPFWQRMSAGSSGSTPEFLSTHPSDSTRISNLRGWIPEAKAKALQFGTVFE
ncbi:M48 family metallopeptidase [Treponema sp. OttesenSCG-928-L16]|nr:M48 family metallopeptidase [Treponema sp. OttesenSCG-928-L16]